MKINYKMLLYFGIGALIIYIFIKLIIYILAFVILVLGIIFIIIKDLFLDGIVYINANILYSTIIIAIIALIGIFFILKRFIKPKKILLYTLIILIPCLIFLRTIPDYSNEYGFNIVSLSNYNKYNQGYCLKENRILSKEERFKRGIMDYWEKGIVVDKMLMIEYCEIFSQYCSFDPKEAVSNIGAYKTNKFNNKNWYEVIKKRQDETNSTITSLIFSDFNITKTQISEDDIVVNLKDNSAGFKKPILYNFVTSGFALYLDRSFVLGKDLSLCKYCNHISFKYDKVRKEDKIKYDKKASIKTYSTKIDNCGNINFSIKRNFYNTKKHIGKGG